MPPVRGRFCEAQVMFAPSPAATGIDVMAAIVYTVTEKPMIVDPLNKYTNIGHA